LRRYTAGPANFKRVADAPGHPAVRRVRRGIEDDQFDRISIRPAIEEHSHIDVFVADVEALKPAAVLPAVQRVPGGHVMAADFLHEVKTAHRCFPGDFEINARA
jgi:hypothetical protein